MQVARDAGVGAVGGASDAMERLFDGLGRCDILREGNCGVAKFGFGVDEDCFVDEVLFEKGSVEMRAALE